MENEPVPVRCAVYTRKSTTNRLESETNSLVTQRQVCSAYITSQQYKGWAELPQLYDDGGQSGGDLERPALCALMRDIELGRIDTVVVYKIDRLTRSLIDFVRLVDLFQQRRINLVSVSQAFDTSDSMGRMVLNILLTFSQFEREMIGERVRDSVRARKSSGKIHGGKAPFGYNVVNDELVIDQHEAPIAKFIFDEFIRTERYSDVMKEVEARGYTSSIKPLRKGGTRGGGPVTSSIIYGVIQNPVYVGEIKGHRTTHKGRHEPLITRETWEAARRVAKARVRPKPNPKDTNHFLAGRLIDELGRPMLLDLPRQSHKHHAYYASSDALWSQAKYIRAYRTHAGRLDALVHAATAEFLCDRIRLRQAIKTLGIKGKELDIIAAKGEAAAVRLRNTCSDSLHELFSALTTSIEVGKDHVSIAIRSFELQRFIEWDDQSAFRSRPSDWPLTDACFEIRLDVRVLSADKWPLLHVRTQQPDENSNPDGSLVELMARARKAKQIVETHRNLSLAELASKARCRPKQFVQLMHLNYLAPDIVSAILDGTQPEGLSRSVLLSADIPTSWSVQREMFGFPAPVRQVRKKKSNLIWHQRIASEKVVDA